MWAAIRVTLPAPRFKNLEMSRVLGLDYGERRIGVAISDPTGTIAQPLPTIRRRAGKRPPFAKIKELIEKWEAESIVVGLPVETSGEEGPQAELARAFGEGLAKRTQLPVSYWDERFTSKRARREMALMAPPARVRREKGRIDALAAVLILGAYLNAQPDD